MEVNFFQLRLNKNNEWHALIALRNRRFFSVRSGIFEALRVCTL